jgi:single-stranded-DNA-specific exonuclease
LGGKGANVGTLGFQVGPRVNAASRMSGRATSAINFLISEDPSLLAESWTTISSYNDQRKDIEKQMIDIAQQKFIEGAPAIVAYHESFEPGVQGIVASKLVEKFGVPAIMLSDAGDDFIVGSGRAGQFLHLRDALQFVEDQHPGILVSFGGHKAAAGLKFHKKDLKLFNELFLLAVCHQLDGQDTTPYIKTDGALDGYLSLDTHYQIKNLAPFGMGFSTPVFNDRMTVTWARMVGKDPVHLSLMFNGNIKAIQFRAIENSGDPMPVNVGDLVDVVYQTDVNQWNNEESLQLKVKRISQS